MSRLCISGSHVTDDSLVADSGEFLRRYKLALADRIPGLRAYVTEKTREKKSHTILKT